jgi:hypothetical protein
VAQCIGPEFKPQYHPPKKKERSTVSFHPHDYLVFY